MHTTLRQPARPQAVAVPAAVALVTLLAVLVAVFAGDTAVTPSATSSPTAAAGTSGRPVAAEPVSGGLASLRIELVVGDEIGAATLHDTPTARAFAAMLPVTIDMDDAFGQVKTGRLPGALDVGDVKRSRSYAAGDLSYWSPSRKLTIVYDALNRSVPAPGLVRLGTVDTGLSVIASAGDDFTMTIRPAR